MYVLAIAVQVDLYMCICQRPRAGVAKRHASAKLIDGYVCDCSGVLMYMLSRLAMLAGHDRRHTASLDTSACGQQHRLACVRRL